MYAGGGGGGGNNPAVPANGGLGGAGGFGFYNKPIAQPFAQPYSVGAPGNAGMGPGCAANPGGAGGATNFTNVGTVNGGNGGNGAVAMSPSGPGNPGNAGTQPCASLTYPTRSFIVGAETSPNSTKAFGLGGNPASSGGRGTIAIFENTGT
jgi:hypothetical protein